MDEKLKNEILQLYRKGMTDKDISYELEIPERLVYSITRRRRNNAEKRQTTS